MHSLNKRSAADVCSTATSKVGVHQPPATHQDEAAGAQVVHALVILPLVEQAADLVDPALTGVALHPVLLDLIVVLLLLQICLAHHARLQDTK